MHDYLAMSSIWDYKHRLSHFILYLLNLSFSHFYYTQDGQPNVYDFCTSSINSVLSVHLKFRKFYKDLLQTKNFTAVDWWLNTNLKYGQNYRTNQLKSHPINFYLRALYFANINYEMFDVKASFIRLVLVIKNLKLHYRKSHTNCLCFAYSTTYYTSISL